ncbi:MAG: glycosyltransferase family 1 protein [Bryobacteraceae bacterium]
MPVSLDAPGDRYVFGLDATYSLGRNLSGVGVYSRHMMHGLASAHPRHRFAYYYRSHRFLRSLQDAVPRNARRRLLRGMPSVDLFHALNQRVEQRARKTVATFHDLFVITGDYSSPDFRARFTEQAREAAHNSDAIIAVSQHTADQLEQLLGVERSRIHVVPHGVAIPVQQSNAARENIILFIGAIQKRKNVARLVRAFERVPADWRLILAGASDGYGAAEELAAVEASPRRAGIDVLGYVTDADRQSLYQRARVFAFPSLDEGFGMPLLEAMAYGVPVVTSRASAMPEVAGDAALLVNPFDEDELAEALVRLTSEEALRARLTQAGLTRASQFRWEDAVAKTWRVYQTLLPGLGD